jgi:hypothetical protein
MHGMERDSMAVMHHSLNFKRYDASGVDMINIQVQTSISALNT